MKYKIHTTIRNLGEMIDEIEAESPADAAEKLHQTMVKKYGDGGIESMWMEEDKNDNHATDV